MHQIKVSDLEIEIVRKDIKHLHLAVCPPQGRIRVSAPLRVNDDTVRLAVIDKLAWLKRQRKKFMEQARESQREYVTGESHYFQGERYLLNVIEQPHAARAVTLNKNRLDLYVRPESDREQRERMVWAWYRAHLKQILPEIIAKWEAIIGVQVAEWGIKHMKTRWGSCNIKARRIWLNLELAKKPRHCLEYVVVHELVHLHERRHNDRFKALMSRFMPNWKLYRAELNRAPLGHALWEC